MTREEHHPSDPATPPDGVTVRFYRDGDDEAFLAMLQQSYARWPAVRISVEPMEHMRWKMRLAESPERRHKVAEIDGKIVGVSMHWPRAALLKGQAVLCGDGSDACVHPDYQGRGVMRAMRFFNHEARQRYALLVVGGTVHPAMIELRKYRFDQDRGEFQNRIERFVRPLTVRDALRRFRLDSRGSPRKLAKRTQRFARWLAARGRERLAPTANGSITVRDVAAFDERVDALCKEASRQFDFVYTRDREYLSWRYDRRGGDFAIKIAEESGRLAGYTVLCTDIERRRGYIADLLVLPGREDVARALVTEALVWARAERLGEMICWLPERHPNRHALDATGFVLRRLKTTMGYRASGVVVPIEELLFLRAPDARIHLMLGDTDTV